MATAATTAAPAAHTISATTAPQTVTPPTSTTIPAPTSSSPPASVSAHDDASAAPTTTPTAAPNAITSPPQTVSSPDAESTDTTSTPALDASAVQRTGGTPAPQITPSALGPSTIVIAAANTPLTSASAPSPAAAQSSALSRAPALHVPAASSANTVRRADSSSSLQRTAIEHENDLVPVTAGAKSRRASDASMTATTPTSAASAAPPAIHSAAQHPDSTSNAALPPLGGNTGASGPPGAHHVSATSPQLNRPGQPHPHAHTTLYAGRAKKAFVMPTSALMAKSAYFKKLLSETPEPTAEQLTFEGVEDPAMALFAQWVNGHSLKVPSGEGQWHEVGHLIALYAAGRKWGCEELGNNVTDVVRTYYASEDMTATPYRLESIYTLLPVSDATSTCTSFPAPSADVAHEEAPVRPLHQFLVETAAWRCLRENSGISESTQEVLGRNQTLMVDFVNALVKLGRDDAGDPRHGGHCVWHLHTVTRKCVEDGAEPWAAD